MRYRLLLILSLVSTPSWGAVTIDASTTAHAINAENISLTHTGAADATLALACVTERDSSTNNIGAGPSVTYGGNAMTLISGATVTAGTRIKASLFYYLSPPTGAQTVAYTRSTNANRYTMTAITLKGTAGANTFNTAGTYSSTASTNIDIDGLASAVGEFAIMCGLHYTQASTVSPDATSPVSTEYLEVDHTDSTSFTHYIYTEDGAATSIDMRVDASVSNYAAAVAVSIRPEAAAIVRHRATVIYP